MGCQLITMNFPSIFALSPGLNGQVRFLPPLSTKFPTIFLLQLLLNRGF